MNNYLVYMHENNINGKRYFGLTNKLPHTRWRKGGGYHHNPHLMASIKKYGWDNFSHYVLAYGLSKEDAIQMEKSLIARWNTRDNRFGYNHSSGGEHSGETHGDHGTHLYKTYAGMRQRCNNPNYMAYHLYGGKGVKNEWESYEEFKLWSLNNNYDKNKALVRIDKDGNYSPSNCVWIDANLINANLITLHGETKPYGQWCKEYGIKRSIVRYRLLQGWPFEEALSKPAHRHRYLTLNNETHTVKEWGEILGIDYRVITKRIDSHGWSVEKALTTPVRKFKNKTK